MPSMDNCPGVESIGNFLQGSKNKNSYTPIPVTPTVAVLQIH